MKHSIKREQSQTCLNSAERENVRATLKTKQTIRNFVTRTAMMLLVLLMTAATAGAETITLTSGTGEVTLQDGDVLTGTGGTNTHVMIADGATVTLSGVNITAISADPSYKWSGITCLGDATITIADGTTNSVKGGYRFYPGIYIPAGYTLTIQGNGSLEAATQEVNGSGQGSGAGIGGISNEGCGNIVIKSGTITARGSLKSAGIGGTERCACGYITIEGGTVTATGGQYAPGIGSGQNGSCGNITIAGGTVTATGNSGAGIGSGYISSVCGNITITGGTITATGGSRAAGIGCGVGNTSVNSSTCGDITITRGVTSVTATKGSNAQHSIGMGKEYCACGTVTIGGVQGAITESPYTYTPSGSMTSTVHFDNNGGSGTMADWQFTYDGAPYAIPACTFTAPEGKIFIGWNTEADGSGAYYANGQQVIDIAYETLYAMWRQPTETVTNGALTLYDGQTLTGTGGKQTHVTIKDGATVTLSGVNITGISTSKQWAGITCEGDATIILGGENAVTGGYNSAGIFVPMSKTVTIRGNGSLTATGHTYAAGIGSGNEEDCGNIVIEGGTITATGRSSAAGIGSGKYGSCGDITITGGSITANASTATAAAIGCGNSSSTEPSSCGNITIANGVTCVIATKISTLNKVNIIGTSGNNSTCGTITVGDGLTDVLSKDKLTRYITAPGWTGTTSVTLAKEGYGTYYSPFDLMLPAGMKARIVTASDDGGQLTYETIANGSTADNTVPAKTAVMLQTAPADGLQTFDVGINVPSVSAISQTNLLDGSDRQRWVPDNSDGTKFYKLTYNISGENIGWYWGADGGGSFQSAANKAWLALPPASDPNQARSFIGLPDFDEATGIQTVNGREFGSSNSAAIYTLDGRKVGTASDAADFDKQSPYRLPKGLYIVNGRKVVIK